MAKKIDYAAMFTLRKDGRYQGSYVQDGKRSYVYDKDPEALYFKLQEAQKPKEVTFGEIAEMWKEEHWGKISLTAQLCVTCCRPMWTDCAVILPNRPLRSTLGLAPTAPKPCVG